MGGILEKSGGFYCFYRLLHPHLTTLMIFKENLMAPLIFKQQEAVTATTYPG